MTLSFTDIEEVLCVCKVSSCSVSLHTYKSGHPTAVLPQAQGQTGLGPERALGP